MEMLKEETELKEKKCSNCSRVGKIVLKEKFFKEVLNLELRKDGKWYRKNVNEGGVITYFAAPSGTYKLNEFDYVCNFCEDALVKNELE